MERLAVVVFVAVTLLARLQPGIAGSKSWKRKGYERYKYDSYPSYYYEYDYQKDIHSTDTGYGDHSTYPSHPNPKATHAPKPVTHTHPTESHFHPHVHPPHPPPDTPKATSKPHQPATHPATYKPYPVTYKPRPVSRHPATYKPYPVTYKPRPASRHPATYKPYQTVSHPVTYKPKPDPPSYPASFKPQPGIHYDPPTPFADSPVYPPVRPSPGNVIHQQVPVRRPQFAPYVQQPYPPRLYPQPQFPVPSPTPRQSSNRNLFAVFLLLFSGLLNDSTDAPTSISTTIPTTIPETTATSSGSCQWNPWSSCSSNCRGTRFRARTCLGNTLTDSEICNTQTGFLPDGLWYRANNCHDYRFFVDSVSYQQAVEACQDVGAQLISTGLRNDDVRTDLYVNIFMSAQHYVGITDQSVPGVYVWTDGHVGNPTFWGPGEPDTGATLRCGSMAENDPWSLEADSCDDDLSYFCERKVQ